MNPKIDAYLAEGCMRCKLGGTPQCKVNDWREELIMLRSIVLECGLTEELKWSVPCYTYKKGNVLIVSAFKQYASISFFKGALLMDEGNLLEKPGENSQATRYFKFTSIHQIKELKAIIRTYIFEAIEVEKAGLKIDFKEKNELDYPDELIEAFKNNSSFKTAFEALTPGKQRGYILHFTKAKQSNTRVARIEKYKEKILEGLGFFE